MLTEDVAADVLSTAIEGGTNYWASCSNIQRNANMGVDSVTLRDEDDADGTSHVVTAEQIAEAILDLSQLEDDVKFAAGLVQTCVYIVREGEDADYDAGDADNIVQYAIFGQIVYG